MKAKQKSTFITHMKYFPGAVHITEEVEEFVVYHEIVHTLCLYYIENFV